MREIIEQLLSRLASLDNRPTLLVRDPLTNSYIAKQGSSAIALPELSCLSFPKAEEMVLTAEDLAKLVENLMLLKTQPNLMVQPGDNCAVFYRSSKTPVCEVIFLGKVKFYSVKWRPLLWIIKQLDDEIKRLSKI